MGVLSSQSFILMSPGEAAIGERSSDGKVPDPGV
jgi:hypothetical protein